MASRAATKLARADALPPEDIVFGVSSVMQEIRQRALKICRTNVPVLLVGDGGTGKEVLARWLHANSDFASGDFVKVNCAAIPGSLLESELFGHEKGAFTGAHIARPGRVERAHLGTLFLDEIGDLDSALQSKLLHFLQDGCFSRLGDQAERMVDTRVMCATGRRLEDEIAAGRFRADLYYRINVLKIEMPRLAQRREDIPRLAEHFRQLHTQQFSKDCEPFGPELIGYLQNLAWPGNLRELSNCIARYIVIGPESLSQREPVRPRPPVYTPAAHEGPVPLKKITKEAIREMERTAIVEALRANHWNRRKAAQALKISYRAMIYKIRDAGLIVRRPAARKGETLA
ncbi:MAG TPA: sigma 54-interacting transcriptional regulator [Candidatus Acidoferrum sp.]|nr:sigma 54-interacting transcriptional regulator [Candidatus Acidoferrum sp.]